MRVAIVVGVGDYANPNYSLPACKLDAERIERLVRATGKWDDITTLISETGTDSVRSKLGEVMKRHQGVKVEELFFYYTGHGNFDGEDFRYLLSDYDPDSPQQTSLPNAEVDQLLRSLSPTVAVKVVDACFSGMSYIKDPEAFEMHVKGTQSGFTRCYFLHSSHSDQKSFATSEISAFTKSFLSAVAKAGDGPLPYNKIMSVIADDFLSFPLKQRPMFVVQSGLQDTFCDVTPDIRAAAEVGTQTPTTSKGAPPALGLVGLIRKNAEECCTREEAKTAVELAKKPFETFSLGGDLADLYAASTSFEDSPRKVPNIAAVGRWLDGSSHPYFVKVTYEYEYYEEGAMVPKPSLFSAAFFGEYEWKNVRKSKLVPAGFSYSEEPSVKIVKIECSPKFQNLPWYEHYAVFVLSKTKLGIFSSHVRMKDTGWESREPDSTPKWKLDDPSLKDHNSVVSVSETIVSSCKATMLKQLNDQFGKMPAPVSKPAPNAQ